MIEMKLIPSFIKTDKDKVMFNNINNLCFSKSTQNSSNKKILINKLANEYKIDNALNENITCQLIQRAFINSLTKE